MVGLVVPASRLASETVIRLLSLAVLLATNVFGVEVARAEDELSTFKANVEGAGWLFPTFTLQTVLHEGSHALAARLIGAEDVQITWLIIDGWTTGAKTRWSKQSNLKLRIKKSDAESYAAFKRRAALEREAWLRHVAREEAFVSLAPQITNLATLTTYTLLQELGVPSNEQLRLPLLVMAFWAWADLAAQLLPIDRQDVEKTYGRLRLTSWQRIPFRVVHLGLVVLGGYYLSRGYNSIFDDRNSGAATPKMVVPLSISF
jgi:hypothetical protein